MAPQFPIVSGTTRLNDEWNITLDGDYARRVEDDCLVLWNSGLTLWFDQYGNDRKQSIQARIAEWMEDVSPDAQDMEQGIDRFSYVTQDEEDEIFRLNGFVFNDGGHLLIEISTDDASFMKAARKIFKSIKVK